MTEADRRQQILEAALRVFSREGFYKASIKSIAREAEIKSSALIYWYFKDKRELLEAVMTEMSPLGHIPIIHPEIRQKMLDDPPHQVLTMMATGLLGLEDNPETMQMLRIYISEAVRTPEVADMIGHLQKTMLEFLVDYLNHQIKIGTLRPHDVQTSARAFVGTLIGYLLVRNVWRALQEGTPEREQYIQEVINVFLKGIENA